MDEHSFGYLNHDKVCFDSFDGPYSFGGAGAEPKLGLICSNFLPWGTTNQAKKKLNYHRSKQRYQAGRGIFSSTRVQEVRVARGYNTPPNQSKPNYIAVSTALYYLIKVLQKLFSIKKLHFLVYSLRIMHHQYTGIMYHLFITHHAFYSYCVEYSTCFILNSGCINLAIDFLYFTYTANTWVLHKIY